VLLQPGPSPLFGLAVHHADPHLVVVDKPAGVVMHPGHPRPQVSLREMLRRELWASAQAPDPVHRLDRQTSGLVAFALDSAAVRALGRAFEARRVEKGYIALVWGEPADDSGTIDLPLGPGGDRPARMRVGGPGARPARTHYTVRARGRGVALLELTPETGRRHQLRVHLAAIGHPILGDALYGPGGAPAGAPALAPGRHALHAASLAFEHPDTGAWTAFRADLPGDMAALAAWRQAAPAPSARPPVLA
jgi:RluA family pseudouridine synthase